MQFVKRIVVLVVTLGMALAFAQSVLAEDNMQILRDKIKADKKLVVAVEMKLTDAEGKVFWPLYEGYQKDLEGINKRTVAMIAAYADAWNAGSMNDEKAKKMTSDFLAISADEVKLLTSYAAKLDKALPAAKVARCLQIENKIRTIVKYDLVSKIPLVP